MSSGVKIVVKADTRELTAAMAKLRKKGGDAAVQVALKSVGETLLNSTRERMNRQVAPDGAPWAPLNKAYAGTLADRDKNGRIITKGVKKGLKILQESGQLFGTLRWQVSGEQLQLGTNKIYGAIHQFGGTIRPRSADNLVFWLGGQLVYAKKVTIPARPFLGLSSEDRKRAVEDVEDVYDALWGGGEPK